MGRPPIFETPEAIEQAIEAYFAACEGEMVEEEDDTGYIVKVKRGGQPITITGLALYLGFESRQSFYDYEKKEEFSYIIRRARLRVECSYEQNLQTKYCTGSVFALKNMGWKDTQEIKHALSPNILNIDPLGDSSDNSPTQDSPA